MTKSRGQKYAVLAAILLPACLVFVGTAHTRTYINAVLITGWEYNSNFWLAETDEVSVDTFYIKPGVEIGYESAKSKIEADFLLEPFWYNDRDTPPPNVRDASEDDYLGFTGNFLAETQATDRLHLGVTDSLRKTRDPAQSDALSDSTARDLYLINRFIPSAYYGFGDKFGLGLKYGNTYIDYTEGTSEGSKENRGVANFFYNLNRSASFFLSYDYWNRDYEYVTSTYDSNEVKMNYVQQFHYFSIDAGAGYHHRSFENDRLDSLDLIPWHLILRGQNPPAPDEDPRSHMLLSFRHDYNDLGSGNQYYIASRVTGEVGHIFMKKIETKLEGYYQNSDYQNNPLGRNDDTYEISGLMGYRFWEYGQVNFEVGYRTRDSNIEGMDYDDTFTLLTLELDYPF